MFNNRIKYALLGGQVSFSFIMSATIPTVQLHFMKLVEPTVYASSIVLQTFIAAIVQTLMSREEFRRKISRVLIFLLIIDVVAFWLVSVVCAEHVSIRFIGMSVLSATTSSLWLTTLRGAINNVLSSNTLTDFEALSGACNLWADLAGGILAMVFVNMNIELAIYLQCIGNLLYAVSDYYAYRRLTQL